MRAPHSIIVETSQDHTSNIYVTLYLDNCEVSYRSISDLSKAKSVGGDIVKDYFSKFDYRFGKFDLPEIEYWCSGSQEFCEAYDSHFVPQSA